MNSNIMFVLSFFAVVLSAIFIAVSCDIIVWLLSVFLLTIFVPLLFYSAIHCDSKT